MTARVRQHCTHDCTEHALGQQRTHVLDVVMEMMISTLQMQRWNSAPAVNLRP